MPEKEISFGGTEAYDYLPALSDGEEIKFKMISAPERYESLFGEKIKVDIDVRETSDLMNVNLQKYTVSSSAVCWKSYAEAYLNPECKLRVDNMSMEAWREASENFLWKLEAKGKGDRVFYKLSAIEQVH